MTGAVLRLGALDEREVPQSLSPAIQTQERGHRQLSHRCSHYLQRRPRQALRYRTRLRLHHPRQARRGCQAAVRTGGHGTGGQKYPWRNPQSREAVSCWVCDDGPADETIFLIR